MTEIDLVRAILRSVTSMVKGRWIEIMIDYHVDHSQSTLLMSYLVEHNGQVTERDIDYIDGLDGLLRSLREVLSKDGRNLFSRCKIHVFSSGKYEASYGYGPIDWDDFVPGPESLFDP